MKNFGIKSLGIISLLLLSAVMAPAQTVIDASKNIISKVVAVDNFDEIVVSGSIQTVIYTQNQTNNSIASIDAPDNVMEYIECYVKNGVLNVHYKSNTVSFRKLNQQKAIKVNVSSHNLKSAKMNGSGSLYFGNNVSVQKLEVDVQGSGCINGQNVTCEHLDITVNGSGNAVFKEVKALNSNINVHGTGLVKLADMCGNTCTSSLTGSGNVIIMMASLQQNINAIINGSGMTSVRELNVPSATLTVRGSGEMTVTGRAQQASISLHSSGTINSRKFEVTDLSIVSNGSGSLYCCAIDKLTTDISGSSRVLYAGKPQSVTHKGKKKGQSI